MGCGASNSRKSASLRVSGQGYGAFKIAPPDANALLVALLKSPAPMFPDEAKKVKKGKIPDIASKYGLSPNMIMRPGGAIAVASALGLKPWNRTLGIAEAKAVPPEQRKPGFIGLITFLAISVLVDPAQPESKEYREYLQLKDPQGPFCYAGADAMIGGFAFLLYPLVYDESYARTPVAVACDRLVKNFLMHWAKLRAEDIGAWLGKEFALLEKEQSHLKSVRRIKAPQKLLYTKEVVRPGQAMCCSSAVYSEESNCRLHKQGTLLPPQKVYDAVADRLLVFWVAALAKAVDFEFQQRIGRVVETYCEAQGVLIKHTSAPPKTFQRMLAKLDSDHLLNAPPRACNNVDVCRCGLVVDAPHAVGLFKAIDAEVQRTGGKVVRVKNAFQLSADQAAAQYGYRAILTNYHFVCEGVTYGDVLPQLVRLQNEILETRYGKVSLDGYRDFALSPEVRTKPIELMVETQIILPLFAEARKLSHWPYKFVRCMDSREPLKTFFIDVLQFLSADSDW